MIVGDGGLTFLVWVGCLGGGRREEKGGERGEGRGERGEGRTKLIIPVSLFHCR